MSGRLSRRAEVIDLAKGGYRPLQIARLTGLPAATVYKDISLARANDPSVPRFGPLRGPSPLKATRHVKVPAPVIDRLVTAARQRGLLASELAAELLARIVDDGLVDAILDDQSAEGSDD